MGARHGDVPSAANDVEAVSRWLETLGLGAYAEVFSESGIDLQVLPDLTDADLRELGLPLGPRKKLLRAIAALGNHRAKTEPIDVPARPPEAERRQLTVMFVDLVGSTALSAKLDPEDMREVIRGYQDTVAGEIGRFEGHIAKFMGDGVLAYFGYPRAHEDAAERAVRAGLALVQTVSRLKTPAGEALAARVGIATGLVVVGDLVGEGAAQEAAVVGDTPNLAARLQGLAEPGSAVIAEATRRLVGGLFELADLGGHHLKGFKEPVRAWRVLGESRAESRFEAFHGQQLTALVGREHEIGLLADRWERAKEGEGQVVLLSGEPGIGKSRIVRALRERLAGEPHTPLPHYCSPHHTNSALYPVIGLLERAAGFARDDRVDARLDKLEALLARGTETLGEAVPLVAALLRIESGARYPALALSPQRQKQRTLEVLVDQADGLAARQPVLAVYEDVHWIDPTTLELLGLLIQRVQRLPVLVLITFRPEFSPPWTGHAHVMQLSLSRLTRQHGQALVETVTGGKALPDEVLDQILAKTDGVPLFVEELTKAVLESGLLRHTADHYELAGPLPTLAIPATLHDSLMARLDRLAPVKEIAQTAAVIGREFSHELLAAVAPLSGSQLRNALDQLTQSELVFQRGMPPTATYAFKHALVQDTAYQSLLKSRRQFLHGQIADVLEAGFPDTAEHAPGVLARHLSEAGMAERASEYYERAGQQALAHSASKEAVAHFGKALEQLRTLSKGPERTRREIALLTAQAGALVNVTGLASDDLERTYIEARDLCEQLGDPHQQFVVEWGLWHVYIGRAEHHRARELADRLIARAESERDAELMLQALHADWSMLSFMGDNQAARDRSEQGWALYDREVHGGHAFIYGGHDPGVCSRNMGSWAVWRLGYPDQARRWHADGLALAKELAHPQIVAHAFSWGGPLHQFCRDQAKVKELADAALTLASEQALANYYTDATILEGWLLAQDGEVTEAIRVMRDALAVRQAKGTIFLQPYYLTLLAQARADADEISAATELLSEALDRAENTGELWIEAELHRLKGELLLYCPDRADAQACFKQAIDIARAQSAKSWELRAATSLARLWRDQGERQKAHDLLAPVFGWFTEGFDTADLMGAKALLDQLA